MNWHETTLELGFGLGCRKTLHCRKHFALGV